MSKQEKLLEKLRRKPPPSDFKWKELVTLLRSLGFKELTNTGSRRKFYNADKDVLINCHKPHPEPDVDKGCITDIVDVLQTNGLI